MLEEGAAAPNFEARDQTGKLWRLSDLSGRKVILYFYPADDTPGCTIEACDFRDAYEELSAAGYVVLGVSPQGADSHRAFAQKFSLNFPLLVDEDGALARAYGVWKHYGEWEGVPLKVKRSTFVIDEQGRLDRVMYGVRAKGHVASLRESLGSA